MNLHLPSHAGKAGPLAFPEHAARLALALWLIGALTGCRSGTSPGSQSHAAVQIPGRSRAEIQRATVAVFQEAGYRQQLVTPTELTFERPGTRREALQWGDLGGVGVNVRVRVNCTEQPGGGWWLRADAQAIQIADDPFFQTEHRMRLLNRRPYQELLDTVAARLR